MLMGGGSELSGLEIHGVRSRAFLRSPTVILAGILLLAMGLRLYHVGALPLGRHDWRQSDTAAVARNFYEHGYRFLQPEVDWGAMRRDSPPGPTAAGMEFPVYQFTTALLYGVFGVNVVWARILSVVGSLIGVFFFHRLVELQIDRRTANWSCLLYAILPLSIYYGRTIQPESWLIAASIAGIYCFARWVRSDRARFLVVSALCIALACLLKFALYLGLPLLYLTWTKYGARSLVQWRLWIYAVIVLVPCVAWYGYSGELAQKTGVGYGVVSQGLFTDWDLILTWEFYNKLFFRQLAERHFTWIGFVVLLVGIALPRREPGERLFDFWALGVLVYFFLAAKLNYIHEYYQMPLTAPACVFMGKVFARGWTNRRAVLLPTLIGIILFSGWRWWAYMLMERPGSSPHSRVAEVIAEHTNPVDPVITASARPIWLYLSHRKGWREPRDGITAERIQSRVENGARYLVGRRESFSAARWRMLEEAFAAYTVVYDDGDIFLLRLTPDGQ